MNRISFSQLVWFMGKPFALICGIKLNRPIMQVCTYLRESLVFVENQQNKQEPVESFKRRGQKNMSVLI